MENLPNDMTLSGVNTTQNGIQMGNRIAFQIHAFKDKILVNSCSCSPFYFKSQVLSKFSTTKSLEPEQTCPTLPA